MKVDANPRLRTQPTQASAQLRCCCGSLMARLQEQRIELKCRRCKRVIRLRPVRLTDGEVSFAVEGDCRCDAAQPPA